MFIDVLGFLCLILSMLLYAKNMKLDLCQKGENEMLINELKHSLFASSVPN